MINEKVAIVTGATRGIGHAIAIKLAEEGFAVAAVGTRIEEEVEDNINDIKKYGMPVVYIKANISEEEDRKKVIQTTMNTFGRIDVLVNNAGVAPKVRMDILDMTEESMDYVLGVNLKGTFFLTQLAAKIMVDEVNSIEEIKPKIINISSVSAYTSSTQRGEYCISKAAASMITKLFADRLAEYGINVYEIRPGIIATDMTSKVKEKYDNLINGGLTPIKRWGYPEDVANAVSVFCSDKLNFSTGEVINVDGGFHIRRL
jgi:3-oxoacyl-[acyl-carrier protein] reductase